jgi:putative transcriptional regulator
VGKFADDLIQGLTEAVTFANGKMAVSVVHDWRRADAMTDAGVHEAAINDPDARPMSDEYFVRARRVPRAKTLRRALGLAQEEFAARFHIPVGTLRDWEQGLAEPDQTARAYLKVIADDPDAVRRALDRPGATSQ